MKIVNALWRLFKRSGSVEQDRALPSHQKPTRKAKTVKMKKVTVQLPEDLIKAYKHAAVAKSVTMQSLIETALRRYLDRFLAE